MAARTPAELLAFEEGFAEANLRQERDRACIAQRCLTASIEEAMEALSCGLPARAIEILAVAQIVYGAAPEQGRAVA